MADRRIDYIFSAWPRPGGAGHPVRCELIGAEPVDGIFASDHFGVVADLRYQSSAGTPVEAARMAASMISKPVMASARSTG